MLYSDMTDMTWLFFPMNLTATVAPSTRAYQHSILDRGGPHKSLPSYGSYRLSKVVGERGVLSLSVKTTGRLSPFKQITSPLN